MQYILGFHPAITALGIRESEIQHPASVTPSHENHEFCEQHGPEPRFPGHINGYNPACQLLRSNEGTPNSWVYSDMAVQTLKALTSIQTRVSTRYLNSAGPLTRVPVIAPSSSGRFLQLTQLLIYPRSVRNSAPTVLPLVNLQPPAIPHKFVPLGGN